MIELETNAKWIREIAKHATFSSLRSMGWGSVCVAVSVNRFDKLEEWAHGHMAPVHSGPCSIWHSLMFYGMEFVYDHRLDDDELQIKEKP
jgi:hypothetical protein